MATHILFLVSAFGCGTCLAFEPLMDPLMTELAHKYGDRLELQPIKLAKRNPQYLDFTKVPLDLARYIQWYPTFVLVPRASLLDAMARGHGAPMAGVKVFNGQLVGTGIEAHAKKLPPHELMPLNLTTVVSWVGQMMQQPLPAAPPPLPPRPGPDPLAARSTLMDELALNKAAERTSPHGDPESPPPPAPDAPPTSMETCSSLRLIPRVSYRRY
jgi:thiol-disulfide isomerase/thioredoxin